MIRVLSILISAVLLVLCLAGCVSVHMGLPGSVVGKGTPETYEIKVGEYSAVRIDGFCNVDYYSAPSDTVTLRIHPNLREYFQVEVQNGELIVRTTRRINLTDFRTPVLTVSVPVLERLDIRGAGGFTAYDAITADSFTFKVSGASTGSAKLDVNSLNTDLSGAGSFTLSGRADTAEMTMSGAGELDALELNVQSASVRFSGAGAVSVNVSENLSINASGMGVVNYKGGAVTDIRRSGMVSVVKLD